MKEFLPLFLDFNETTQDLSDDECGRLIRALVHYANNEDYELSGNELIAFRFLKGSIDRNKVLSAVRAEAGSKGGKQKQANSSKSKQEIANDSKNALNNNNNININTNTDINNPFLSDDEANGIQSEHDRVLDAAEDAGFKMSNSVRASLIKLYSQYGLDKMLEGLSACVTYGAANLAYLGAVLKGEPKKAKPKVGVQDYGQRDYTSSQDEILDRQKKEFESRINGKKVLAQQYEQRDYSGVQDELMAQQDREMEEFLRTGGVA